LIESIGPGFRERFAFDPASNIVDLGAPETAHARSEYLGRRESMLPASMPKVLGNLLKDYAGAHFGYDAQRNLVQRRSLVGVQRFEWDAFNRMRAADVEETSRRSASRYFYDALGRRIGKEVNGSRTVFGWDGDTLAYESNDSRSTHYVYEAATFVPMVQYVSEPVEGIETPVVHADARYVPEEDPLQRVPVAQSEARVMFYHCDQIGTPLMMTDEAGEVVWEAAYKAWGEAREVIGRASGAAGVGLVVNSLRFQGQQVDDETGLHYNRHRYYDSLLGRFVSRDPIGLIGGVNVYQYAPNPNEWVDPLGLWPGQPRNKDGKFSSGQKPTNKCSCDDDPCDGKIHGNSLDTKVPAIGYTLRDRTSGAVLKYGETTLGKARYSQSYLDSVNADMQPEVAGSKREMHCWQHQKILKYKAENGGARPPLNLSDY